MNRLKKFSASAALALSLLALSPSPAQSQSIWSDDQPLVGVTDVPQPPSIITTILLFLQFV